MFDGSEYDDIPYTKVECKEHLEIAHRAALESIVLLKNENQILPLKKENLHTIGVIGPNADSRSALIGNYHGTSSEYVTVLEGIRRYVNDDIRILYSEGCSLSLNKTESLAQDLDRLSEAVTVAENSDVVILCLGLEMRRWKEKKAIPETATSREIRRTCSFLPASGNLSKQWQRRKNRSSSA